jgi:cytoskeletal protein RodZ
VSQQLGDLLKTTREMQGLSLDQAAEDVRIRRHLLEALEDNNFDQFPSPVITRGLIRNYAKYLDLDPIEALTLYDGNGYLPVKGQRLTPNGIEFMSLSMAPRPLITWDIVLGILLFLVVVGGATYLAYSTIIQPGQVTPTPTKTPVVAGAAVGESDENAALLLPTVTPTPSGTPTPVPPTATPTPIVYNAVTVELIITQPSWTQILADDVKVFEGVLQPGENRIWTGQRRVAVRVGNAGGVEVIVNGQSQGILGAEGEVVDRIYEKVDDPAQLTPTPETNELEATAEPTTEPLPPTEEPAAPAEDTTAPASDETPLPLESAPTGEETPATSEPAPEGQ